MTKEQTITKFMKNLGITREEAIQLIADDDNGVSVELTAEQQKVAKQMAQGDRKKETEKRVRERKPDEAKRLLIRSIADFLVENGFVDENSFQMENIEREFTFEYLGEKFRITLMKPRAKKE